MRGAGKVSLPSLAVGIAAGVLLSGAVLGVGVTHLECSQGSVVGWSGSLATPIALGIPPPGGLVNWSFSLGSSSGSMQQPVNSTSFDYAVMNWTAVAETPITVAGWGPSAAGCPSLRLVYPITANGGCAGCSLAPGVPGGIGEKTVIPEVVSLGSVETPYLNASYPTLPLGTFSWNIVGGGGIYTDFSNLTQFGGAARAYQQYPGAPFSGLELNVVVHDVGFGVPIHLRNGTLVILPSDTPQWSPGTGLDLQISYIFPGAGDNRTWAMYAAGAGSPYPLGGYLFEELN